MKVNGHLDLTVRPSKNNGGNEMLIESRTASRFVGFSPERYMVVGLSFRPVKEVSVNSGYSIYGMNFKIGDVEKPIDIISELQVSEQSILN